MTDRPHLQPVLDELLDRQRERWLHGDRVTLEKLLGEANGKALSADEQIDLIYAEICLRQESGEKPQLSDYVPRFPKLADQLERLFLTEEWLADASSANAFPPAAESKTPAESGDAPADERAASPAGNAGRQCDAARIPRPGPPGALQIRCPHCRNPIEVADDAQFINISCPSCGSSFSLIGDETLALGGKDGGRDCKQRFGHFELVQLLGEGAFGRVWKARDTQLDRTVALKVPRKGQLSAKETEKFVREARAAAQLQHAGIVSVFEVGLEGETLYIVSEFVEGVSLADWLAAKRPGYRQAAELCVKVADALHYAHERGVVHRDLKPSNILIDGAGGPQLMDFGLAKREAGEITMTVDGEILGTPAYMSPEQAKGEAHAADRRSDVYSLGVVLFELLTLERPFRGNVRMLVKQVIQDPPRRPRTLDDRIPRDLETICLKCLEKEPRRRYDSAADLAAELTRYLGGRPIHARPVGRLERGWRWCKRQPLVASLVAAVAIVLLAGIIVSSTYALIANREKDRAKRQEARADAGEKLAEKVRGEGVEAKELAVSRYKLALRTLNRVVFDIQRKLVNVPGAQGVRRDMLEAAVKDLEKLAADVAGNSRSQVDLLVYLGDRQTASALIDLGDLFMQFGDEKGQNGTEKARESYQRAFEITKRLADSKPGDSLAARDLSISLEKLGDVTLRLGFDTLARKYFEQDLEVSRRLAKSAPNDAQTVRGLAGAYDRLGDVNLQSGDPVGARKNYEHALETRRRLVKAAPEDTEVQRGLLISCNDLGRIAVQLRETEAARKYFEEGLIISRHLAEAHPNDPQTLRDLSIVYGRLGQLTVQLKDFAAARSYYQQGLEFSRRLADTYPDDHGASLNLSQFYRELGDVALRLGNLTDARKYYKQGLDICNRVAEADRTDVLAAQNVVLLCGKLENLETTQANNAEALRWSRLAMGQAQQMVKHGQMKETGSDFLRLKAAIAECERKLKDADKPTDTPKPPEKKNDKPKD
jgi:tetratricopeptide (TPR) repeat protein/tRNA A-37 threonylcarbamoyl transferase component Bud32